MDAKAFKFVRISIIIAATVISFAACKRPKPQETMLPPQPAVINSGGPQNSYADLVSHVAPAVVTIRSAKRVRAPQQQPFLNDPFFRDFFGNRGAVPQPQPQVEHGLGSG